MFFREDSDSKPLEKEKWNLKVEILAKTQLKNQMRNINPKINTSKTRTSEMKLIMVKFCMVKKIF